ncbi:glycosyltransferase [Herbaspirillum sp. DW155]|uniref:glycosyltransferase n=1 Tax=Herbaspirillum sp. DW155 TaxID=3095609 RepID=UPI0030862C75|nr:glycosyltransferase [Herbaspirillum sp. DW155]
MTSPAPRILFIFLEFPDWRMARSLAYTTQMGMEQTLRQSGADVLSVPSIYGMDNNSRGNWPSRLRQMIGQRSYDQVWIELVHADYDEDFLTWVASLAPVRLGFVMESLQYEPYVYELEPNLRERRQRVVKRMAHMTHVLLVDEQDAGELNQSGQIQAMWWPQTVPRASIQVAPTTTNSYAVFYGALYGKRQDWMKHPKLNGLLVQPGPSMEYQTDYPALFDRLQSLTTHALGMGLQATPQMLERYLGLLRTLRHDIFSLWLRSLQKGVAVANLPSFFQGFPSRVYEGMAAGKPVISCSIPGRPRTNALFQDEQDILLYDPESPEHLAHQIDRLNKDRVLAQRLATNARQKILTLHTTELRVAQILRWLRDGVEVDFSRSEPI